MSLLGGLRHRDGCVRRSLSPVDPVAASATQTSTMGPTTQTQTKSSIVSGAARAGLTLSGSRVRASIRARRITKNTSPLATLSVTGALEKVIADILDASAKVASEKKGAKRGHKTQKYKLGLPDIVAAIGSSKDLAVAFAGYSMASRKTNPTVTTQILSKTGIAKRKARMAKAKAEAEAAKGNK